MATWYRVVSAFAMLAFCGAGAFYLRSESQWWRIAGVAFIAFGIAAFLDVLVSRIVLEEDAIHIISLVRKRSYARSDFDSAKVDGGSVCLKRNDGGWLILPGTGNNSLGVRNTVHAWIKKGRE